MTGGVYETAGYQGTDVARHFRSERGKLKGERRRTHRTAPVKITAGEPPACYHLEFKDDLATEERVVTAVAFANRDLGPEREVRIDRVGRSNRVLGVFAAGIP